MSKNKIIFNFKKLINTAFAPPMASTTIVVVFCSKDGKRQSCGAKITPLKSMKIYRKEKEMNRAVDRY